MIVITSDSAARPFSKLNPHGEEWKKELLLSIGKALTGKSTNHQKFQISSQVLWFQSLNHSPNHTFCTNTCPGCTPKITVFAGQLMANHSFFPGQVTIWRHQITVSITLFGRWRLNLSWSHTSHPTLVLLDPACFHATTLSLVAACTSYPAVNQLSRIFINYINIWILLEPSNHSSSILLNTTC